MNLPKEIRLDIQLLRAVAVAMVLLFHAKIPGLPGGFLGVDVFLVLSGYLITGLIVRGIEVGSFRILDFYFRRAKRLLPASYVVYVSIGFFGLYFLSDSEFQRYRETLVGALTFTSNFTLWQGTDYFGNDAKFNVLLHTWSLSLEEQFYFLFPFLLLICRRNFWRPMVLAGLALSLVLCFALVSFKPVASFYLLPTRAWELLLGSAIVLHENSLRSFFLRWSNESTVVALGVLFIVPVFLPGEALGFVHPTLDAILVALATAVLIIVRSELLNRRNFLTRIGHGLGNISYSLYLVHWPIFAFAENAFIGIDAPLSVRLVMVVVSVGLAAALYAFIERPFHLMRLEKIRWTGLLFFVVMTMSVWFFSIISTKMRHSPRDYHSIFQPNYGISKECDFSGVFYKSSACLTGDSPSTLLWGDSFAMHLARALPDSNRSFVQATMSGCAPALGMAQIDYDAGQGRKWAGDCVRFNDGVLNFIETNPSIKTIVIASQYDQLLGGKPDGLVRRNGVLSDEKIMYETGLSNYLQTVASLLKLGRRVIIIGPTPSVGVNMALCVERREMGLLRFGSYRDCGIVRKDALAYRESTFRLLDELRKLNGVEFFDLFDILCDEVQCPVTRGKVILFRDASHLSIGGSDYIRENNLLVF